MPSEPPVEGQSTPFEENEKSLTIGSALLTNTTVCEASRSLFPSSERYNSRHSTYPLSALRICDLMLLIDSVVLYDQIFYLPASLPDDTGELGFRNGLVEGGVLASIPRGKSFDRIGQALLAAFSTVDNLRRIAGGNQEIDTAISFDDFKPRLMDELKLTEYSDLGMGERWRHYLAERYYYVSGVASGASTFDNAVRGLIGWMEYGFSGRYEDSANSLRAMHYAFASEHYNIPYVASIGVREVQENFPNYFRSAVRGSIYEKLATALRVTVDKVAQQFEASIVFVPPFSAIVLDRAASPEDMLTETLALRSEYSEFREKMRQLEHERTEAKSLNDRVKILRRIEQLGKEVTRHFDQPAEMKMEPTLRYIPDAAELLANPANPSGWVKVLLGLPTELLLGWYRRRPVSKLVQTSKTVGALSEYDSLLTKHFGAEMASKTLEIQKSPETWLCHGRLWMSITDEWIYRSS